MKEETITREHRVLDELDLNNINNTFLLIRNDIKTARESFNTTTEMLKNDIKTAREMLKEELKNTRIQIDSLEKNTRIQIDSLKWVLGFLVAGVVAILIKLFV